MSGICLKRYSVFCMSLKIALSSLIDINAAKILQVVKMTIDLKRTLNHGTF